ncbi:MAG: hypothetical protein HYV63_27665 [Candidatus Schekmanbacteria bacterium]|nr:hypothetical protein [Candidatus Schekmanbacteria bacterium]
MPDEFVDGKDGPCHADDIRKTFWTDVLKSLTLSYELLFAHARLMNRWVQETAPEELIPDLDERIQAIRADIR